MFHPGIDFLSQPSSPQGVRDAGSSWSSSRRRRRRRIRERGSSPPRAFRFGEFDLPEGVERSASGAIFEVGREQACDFGLKRVPSRGGAAAVGVCVRRRRGGGDSAACESGQRIQRRHLWFAAAQACTRPDSGRRPGEGREQLPALVKLHPSSGMF